MSETGQPTWTDDDLKEAWKALSRSAASTDECPEPDQIWKAANGELGAEETRSLIDHLPACPSCAEAWRLALEMGRAEVQESTAESAPALPSSTGSKAFWRRYGLAAAAAVVAVAIGVQIYRSDEGETVIYRGGSSSEIRSLVEARVQTPSDFLLRWEGGPADATIVVSLFDESMELLWSFEGSLVSGLILAPSVLEDFPKGTRLTWQVVATPRDGGDVIASDLYTIELGSP